MNGLKKMRKKREKLNPKATVHKKYYRYILRYMDSSPSCATELKELRNVMTANNFKKTRRQDIHNYLTYLAKMSLIYKKGRNNYFISKKGQWLLIAYDFEKKAEEIYNNMNLVSWKHPKAKAFRKLSKYTKKKGDKQEKKTPEKKDGMRQKMQEFADKHKLIINPYAEAKIEWMEKHERRCYCEPNGSRICPCKFCLKDIKEFNGCCLCRVFVTDDKMKRIEKYRKQKS